MATGLPLLPDDRLRVEGTSLTNHGCTILNIWELEQGWQPFVRNTEVIGLPVGRPETPQIDAPPRTLALHVIGDVDLTLPTPNEYTLPKVGVRANWRELVAVFEQQFLVPTLEVEWDRRTEAGGWETLSAYFQFAQWQINNAAAVDFFCSVEVTQFTEWFEGS